MLAHLRNDRIRAFSFWKHVSLFFFLSFLGGIIKKKKKEACYISAFSRSVAALTVASVCCAEIGRLWRARERTPEIHPSQSEATADTLQRGTINKGIIQQ